MKLGHVGKGPTLAMAIGAAAIIVGVVALTTRSTAKTTASHRPPVSVAASAQPNEAFRLRFASGALGAPHCALLASTEAERNVGLMDRKTVEPFVGMLFTWTQPTIDEFYMKNTLLPLTVAWFGTSGTYLGSANMAPCPKTVTLCPTFSAPRAYLTALEVPLGQLGHLGVGAGTTIQLTGPCFS